MLLFPVAVTDWQSSGCLAKQVVLEASCQQPAASLLKYAMPLLLWVRLEPLAGFLVVGLVQWKAATLMQFRVGRSRVDKDLDFAGLVPD